MKVIHVDFKKKEIIEKKKIDVLAMFQKITKDVTKEMNLK